MHEEFPIKRAFAWLGAAALAKGALLFFVLPAFLSASPGDYQGGLFPDGYNLIAERLVAGDGYRMFADTSPTMLRTPGFVLVLAAIFAMGGPNLAAVQAVQLLFSLLTAPITYAIARRSGLSRLGGGLAAGIFLFHPGVCMSETRGGIETTFTLSLALVVWLTLRATQERGVLHWYAAGAAFGWAMLVKSSVAFVLPALWLLRLARERTGPARGRTLVGGFAAAFTALAIMAPWIVRNYELSGRFVPTMTVAGLAAFQGQYVVEHLSTGLPHRQILEGAAAQQLVIAREMQLRTKASFFPQFYDAQDEIRYYGELGHRTWARFLQRPTLLARAALYNSWAFWFQGRTPTATLLNSAVTAPFLALAAWGLMIGSRRGVDLTTILVSGASYYLPHLFILALARYYIPLVPLLAVLAALPAEALVHRIQSYRTIAPA
jgi:4-amino-4-deoxy-L-arabinose transferase-like glycosyltransferase